MKTPVLSTMEEIDVSHRESIFLAKIEEIVTTPGIDAVDIGDRDLAQSTGLSDPKEVGDTTDGAVEHVVKAGVRAGIPVGAPCLSRSPEDIRHWMKTGCRIFWGDPDRIRGIARELGIGSGD